MTEREKMISGEYYNASDTNLVKDRIAARYLTREYNNLLPDDFNKKNEILKKLLGKKGNKIYMEPNIFVDYGYNIFIGENFYCNFNCTFLDSAPIKIGNNVMLAPEVKLLTAYHPLDAKKRNCGLELASEIIIGDNVWIGAGAIINPGVNIGDNVVVGSGSVVTKDVSSNVVVGGIPARVLKNI